MATVEPQENEQKIEADAEVKAALEAQEKPEGEKDPETPAEEATTITLGDEVVTPTPDPEDAKAPEWVRELRKSHREAQRELRELRAKLAEKEPAQEAADVVPPKPTLESSDYDTEKYEADMVAWYESKRAHDERVARRQAEAEANAKTWEAKKARYTEGKGALKLPDYDDAEEAVQQALNVIQQGIIIQAADNPAHIVYALGKSPARAKELAQITDPVRFAAAIGKLEAEMKVTKTARIPPKPETVPTGSAPKSGTIDGELERLRSEAAKTGDYTKVHRYKTQKRAA